MAESIEVRYQTAVEGLQVIAGGDGDAAEIAVQTLDMLRVQTEQLDDAVTLAEFGASDAACYLYPGEDQKAERAAFCRGAGYDHVRVSTLTRKLEKAKGALTEIGLLPRGTAAFSLECAQEIASDALASLAPEQPDRRHGIYDMPDGSRFHSGTGEVTKHEAVETGEPVAWLVEHVSNVFRTQFTDDKRAADYYLNTGAYKVKPLYPSPVPDGEATRKALETIEQDAEAIRLILIDHLHEPERQAFWRAVKIRDRARAILAALLTALSAPEKAPEPTP